MIAERPTPAQLTSICDKPYSPSGITGLVFNRSRHSPLDRRP